MAKLSILAGATSVSVNLWVQNSTSTTGAGLTGIAPAAGLLLTGTKCYYTFAGANAASTQITLAVLATVGAVYSSGGIVTIDDTNLPGVVRLDLPNAVLAAAKGRSVLVMLSGGTNMAPCVLEIELTGWDNQDGVRGGMTALPNAAAAASGGLPTIGATIPNATAGASGGLIINGTNAGTVTLAALTITGATTHTGNVSMAAGLTITQSTANASGISVTGNGTGHGILATSGSGATGDGIRGTAASTNGNGLSGVHSGTGFDLNCTTSPPLQVNATQLAGTAPGSATIGTVTTVTNLTNAPTAGDLTATMKTSVTAAVWDAARTSHVTAGTFGQEAQLIRDGTAQGGDATHITLDAGASATDNFYTNDLVTIIGGTGVGQSRFISAYTGATKSATVSASWSTTPDATSVFTISGFGSIPGATAPTAAQVATAVWQDLTASSDFTTAGSIGLLLVTNINATISSRSTYAGGPVASVTGSVGGDITGKVLGGGASAFTAVGVQADVEQIGGASLATHAAGMIPADVRDIVGAAVSTTTAQLGVNAVQINGVATTSVTTVNANVGTTQPINFTGTAGSALVRSDMVDIAGAAVSTTTAQIGANAVNIGGVVPASATIGTVTNVTNAPTAGDFTATMKTSLNAATPTVAAVTGNVGGSVVGDVQGKVLGGGVSVLSGVGVQADVEQIGGAALATHAAGMIPSDVRDIVGAAVSTTTAQIGANAVQIGGVAPASATIGTVTNVTTVTNLTNAPTAGDFTAVMKTSLNAATPTAAAVTGNVGGNVTGSVGSVVGSVGSVVSRVTANTDQLAGQPITLDANNLLKVDVEDVNGASTLAELLQAQPPVTPTLAQSLMLLYMTLRNQLTTTASQKSIYNSAGTLITKKALSDNGTTYTETTMVSGP